MGIRSILYQTDICGPDLREFKVWLLSKQFCGFLMISAVFLTGCTGPRASLPEPVAPSAGIFIVEHFFRMRDAGEARGSPSQVLLRFERLNKDGSTEILEPAISKPTYSIYINVLPGIYRMRQVELEFGKKRPTVHWSGYGAGEGNVSQTISLADTELGEQGFEIPPRAFAYMGRVASTFYTPDVGYQPKPARVTIEWEPDREREMLQLLAESIADSEWKILLNSRGGSE